MDLIVFIIALAVPIIIGWLTLLLLERHEPVLAPAERWFWAMVLGPTLLMLIVFVCHIVGITKLDLVGFLIPAIVLLLVLGVLGVSSGALAVRSFSPPLGVSRRLSNLKIIAIAVLTLWTAFKVLAGAYDLVGVPTYWDDSFNNWNMRGKIFYEKQRIELTIPVGNGTIQAEGGVGSYPVSLPMLKTWVSVLRGQWREPLVNGLHLSGSSDSPAVFISDCGADSRRLALAGMCLLLSLPLLLIQAVNPYADVFLAAHILIAVLAVYFMAQAKHDREIASWLKLFGLSLGLLVFTKNEASVMYAPILVMLAGVTLLRLSKNGIVSGGRMRKMISLGLLIALVLALPWLAFKWLHGLTFGNAKSVSDMRILFEPKVVQAIWFHLTHEPNWMFLPLVLPLTVIAAGKRAWQSPEIILTLLVAVSLLGQFLIFAFTPLATEAIMQTGLSRGILHVAPVSMMLVLLLIDDLLKNER